MEKFKTQLAAMSFAFGVGFVAAASFGEIMAGVTGGTVLAVVTVLIANINR